jgi:hypothetical protein
MINVPVYLAVETDDPEVALQVALAVADGSPQAQDVDCENPSEEGDRVAYYSIRPAGRNAPRDVTLLRADPGKRFPATNVTVPGMNVESF